MVPTVLFPSGEITMALEILQTQKDILFPFLVFEKGNDHCLNNVLTSCLKI
jgi:hypothetical protein